MIGYNFPGPYIIVVCKLLRCSPADAVVSILNALGGMPDVYPPS